MNGVSTLSMDVHDVMQTHCMITTAPGAGGK